MEKPIIKSHWAISNRPNCRSSPPLRTDERFIIAMSEYTFYKWLNTEVMHRPTNNTESNNTNHRSTHAAQSKLNDDVVPRPSERSGKSLARIACCYIVWRSRHCCSQCRSMSRFDDETYRMADANASQTRETTSERAKKLKSEIEG